MAHFSSIYQVRASYFDFLDLLALMSVGSSQKNDERYSSSRIDMTSFRWSRSIFERWPAPRGLLRSAGTEQRLSSSQRPCSMFGATSFAAGRRVGTRRAIRD